MANILALALIAINFVLGCYAFKFPSDIERCHAGDTDCIIRVSTKFIEFNAMLGHKGINLVPVDPLSIPSISIKQGAESPVNIELQFKNANLIGLSLHRFKKISGFQANPVGKYLLNVKGPVLYLIGPYKISGRVLVLPIQGVGESNITLVNPDITMTFDGQTTTKNNKEYLSINNARLTFTVTRIYYNFKNLYNGDRLLGDSTNMFLNENWNDIFKEIKANIFDAFTLIAANTLQNVFNKVPYKDLFLE